MKTQQPLHVATPLRQSLALTKVAGTSIYLKLDSSQPTGSFKIRGIGHLCRTVSVDQCECVSSSLHTGMLGLSADMCLNTVTLIFLVIMSPFPSSGLKEDVSGLSAAQVSSEER